MAKERESFSLFFKGVTGLVVTATPLVASFSSLEPPWPPAIGYVSAALVVIASGIVWLLAQQARLRRRSRLAMIAAALTVFGLLIYLILYSILIEPIPGTGERVVRGFECTAEARLVHGDACPDLPREALRDAEWDALTLWTRSSVTWARVGLAAAWLVFMAGLVAALSAIAAKPED